MPSYPNLFNNCYPMNNQMNYNKVTSENDTPGPLPGQNMNINQMPFPPQYMNCFNKPYTQNIPGFKNMANYNQFNSFPMPILMNYYPNNSINSNINSDMNSYSMTNPSDPRMV